MQYQSGITSPVFFGGRVIAFLGCRIEKIYYIEKIILIELK